MLIISHRFQIYVILNCIVQEIFLRLAIRFQSSMESTNKDFVPNGNEKNYARGICICTNPYESRQTKPLGKDWICNYDSRNLKKNLPLEIP